MLASLAGIILRTHCLRSGLPLCIGLPVLKTYYFLRLLPRLEADAVIGFGTTCVQNYISSVRQPRENAPSWQMQTLAVVHCSRPSTGEPFTLITVRLARRGVLSLPLFGTGHIS
jgi:hypothetical protein